jgi:hypothetical protein
MSRTYFPNGLFTTKGRLTPMSRTYFPNGLFTTRGKVNSIEQDILSKWVVYY